MSIDRCQRYVIIDIPQVLLELMLDGQLKLNLVSSESTSKSKSWWSRYRLQIWMCTSLRRSKKLQSNSRFWWTYFTNLIVRRTVIFCQRKWFWHSFFYVRKWLWTARPKWMLYSMNVIEESDPESCLLRNAKSDVHRGSISSHGEVALSIFSLRKNAI